MGLGGKRFPGFVPSDRQMRLKKNLKEETDLIPTKIKHF